MATKAPYTELEYLVLSMLQSGCATGYDIRKKLNLMPGGRWSSESGSVYRVLRRLEKHGLVSVTARSGPSQRERTEYTLSDSGLALVTHWMTFPPPRAEFAYLVDSIRTRSFFLWALDRRQRLRVVKTWLDESKRFVSDVEADIKRIPPEFGPIHRFGFQNMLFLARGRHLWLKELYAQVKVEDD